ncbi:MAG: hypothetical protein K2N64_01065 [Anaeroplasmataceae bacterium]|nr:hypothetical protein [Anaeroplasmataceae bacterium]
MILLDTNSGVAGDRVSGSNTPSNNNTNELDFSPLTNWLGEHWFLLLIIVIIIGVLVWYHYRLKKLEGKETKKIAVTETIETEEKGA